MSTETKTTQNVNNKEVIGILALLVLQYILGMIAALFVEFPATSVGDNWKFAMSSLPVILHIVLGILILLGAIMVLIRAIARKDQRWLVVSILGLIGALASNLGGGDFIGSQSAVSSLIMAIGFILTVAAYGWGLVKKA